MTPYEILNTIEKASTLREKLSILRKHSTNKWLKEIFYYTYSPDLKYYVRAPVGEDYVPSSPTSKSYEEVWKEFKSILDRLSKERVPHARELLKQFLSHCRPIEVKWFVRILNRKLSIGVDQESISRIWPSLIRVVRLMLAYLSTEVKQLPQYLYVEPKYDGVRALIIKEDEEVQVFSRNGERMWFLEDVLQKCSIPKNIVLDGEVFYKSWNETMKRVNRGIVDGLRVYVFDIVPYSEYKAGKSKDTLIKRKHLLRKVLSNAKCGILKLTPYYLVPSSQVHSYMDRFLKEGYEGAMCKDPNSYYVLTRSKAWIKFKKVDVDTYKIIGVEEGSGKYRGALGALVVQRGSVVFKVGSGFSDSQRKEFWLHRNELIGQCVEVAVFAGTKESKANFPVFVRLRTDLGGRC